MENPSSSEAQVDLVTTRQITVSLWRWAFEKSNCHQEEHATRVTSNNGDRYQINPISIRSLLAYGILPMMMTACIDTLYLQEAIKSTARLKQDHYQVHVLGLEVGSSRPNIMPGFKLGPKKIRSGLCLKLKYIIFSGWAQASLWPGPNPPRK